MTQEYGKVAKLLHWGMAVCLIAMVGLGKYMEDAPLDAFTYFLYDTHKAIGVTLLGLAIFRFVCRFVVPPPTMIVNDIPPWQLWLAKGVHIGIYILMIIVPLSGWIASSATGFPMTYFGLMPILPIVPSDKMISDIGFEIHEIAVNLLIILFFLHLAGALKHHFINRDDTLRRMLPRR
ncbi:MAG: cytochrome b [Pseudomonadota bacterium]